MSADASPSSAGPPATEETLLGLVAKIFERVPKEKKLTAEVVMQVVKSKYSSQFSAEFLEAHLPAVRAWLASKYTEPAAAAVVPASVKKPAGSEKKKDEDSDDSDSDDDSEDDDDSDDDSDGEEGEENDDDEESSGGDEDDDGDDSDSDDEDDDESDSDDEDDSEEPEKKRARVEGESSSPTVTATGDVHARCQAMVACLKKLQYAVRKRNDSESEESYLNDCLIPLFEKHDLNPQQYGKKDIQRYKMKKELADLQKDGANLSLDRSSRRGRAWFPPTPQQNQQQKPSKMFLDEDEE